MKRSRLLLLIALFGFAPLSAAAQAAGEESAVRLVLFGKAVCADRMGRSLPASQPCDLASHTLYFVAGDGQRYEPRAGDPYRQMLADARVRLHDLKLTATRHAGGQLELIRIQAVKEGKLFDLYYWCEVCTIKAYQPGPCWCCREAFEFRESPATEP